MQGFKKVLVNRYPLFVIISVPILMALATYFNLQAFNRDMNALVRRNATSLAESVGPLLKENLQDIQYLKNELVLITESNEDIYNVSILKKQGSDFNMLVTSNEETTGNLQNTAILNQLAIGSETAYAALVQEPNLLDNVWNVVVPFSDDETHIMVLRHKTDSVQSLLSRTSRDSLIILLIVILATLVIFINHLIFYQRSLETSKLKELDKLKDEFISMAAHELKAPLTGLIGYISLAKANIEKGKLDEIKNNISTLDHLTDNLGNLIEDLLNVSRIDQGRLEVKFAQVDLNNLIKEVTDSYKFQIEQKQLTLNLDLQETPSVNTDPDRLRQIISNLVSNAIKYTPKGSVKVSTLVKQKNIEIKIEDTGVGIPPEMMNKMFGKFFRVKDKQTASSPGTGLGLWISRQIAQKLGGDLFMESIYGTGSVFTITIPLSTK